MGYCINTTEVFIEIDKKHYPAIIEKLSEAINDGRISDWVNEIDVSQIKNNQEAVKALLDECRWSPEFTEEGIDHLYFTGEKMGDEEALFNTLAPYIKEGCYIDFSGEDNYHWRYSFDGNTCNEIDAVVDYEGCSDIINALLKQKEILPTLIGIHKRLDAKIAKALEE